MPDNNEQLTSDRQQIQFIIDSLEEAIAQYENYINARGAINRLRLGRNDQRRLTALNAILASAEQADPATNKDAVALLVNNLVKMSSLKQIKALYLEKKLTTYDHLILSILKKYHDTFGNASHLPNQIAAALSLIPSTVKAVEPSNIDVPFSRLKAIPLSSSTDELDEDKAKKMLEEMASRAQQKINQQRTAKIRDLTNRIDEIKLKIVACNNELKALASRSERKDTLTFLAEADSVEKIDLYDIDQIPYTFKEKLRIEEKKNLIEALESTEFQLGKIAEHESQFSTSLIQGKTIYTANTEFAQSTLYIVQSDGKIKTVLLTDNQSNDPINIKKHTINAQGNDRVFLISKADITDMFQTSDIELFIKENIQDKTKDSSQLAADLMTGISTEYKTAVMITPIDINNMQPVLSPVIGEHYAQMVEVNADIAQQIKQGAIATQSAAPSSWQPGTKPLTISNITPPTSNATTVPAESSAPASKPSPAASASKLPFDPESSDLSSSSTASTIAKEVRIDVEILKAKLSDAINKEIPENILRPLTLLVDELYSNRPVLGQPSSGKGKTGATNLQNSMIDILNQLQKLEFPTLKTHQIFTAWARNLIKDTLQIQNIALDDHLKEMNPTKIVKEFLAQHTADDILQSPDLRNQFCRHAQDIKEYYQQLDNDPEYKTITAIKQALKDYPTDKLSSALLKQHNTLIAEVNKITADRDADKIGRILNALKESYKALKPSSALLAWHALKKSDQLALSRALKGMIDQLKTQQASTDITTARLKK